MHVSPALGRLDWEDGKLESSPGCITRLFSSHKRRERKMGLRKEWEMEEEDEQRKKKGRRRNRRKRKRGGRRKRGRENKGGRWGGGRSCNTESLPGRNRELEPMGDGSPHHPCFLVLEACVAHLS